MPEKRPTLRGRIRAVRGALYLARGRYDQALADFDRGIELHPEDAAAIASRGYTYWDM
jgi:regulator of sirC expression with transglutaminase-like and TPR domain